MTAYEDSETRRANIAFIKRSMETPLLTREHEYALARAWRDESNDAALHELINAYNRLVVSTAGRFKNYGLPVGDLIQEGVVGLLHAAAASNAFYVFSHHAEFSGVCLGFATTII